MLGGCDIRVACPEAKFAVMEPKRGLFAGGGTTVRLPRQIPWPQAMEFLLCADLIPAERALRDGAAQRDRPPRPAARQGPRVRGAHDRQRAARGAGDEGERAQGPVRRRGRDHAGARARRARCAPRSSRSTPPIPATAQGAIAASVEVLTKLGKELRTAFEKESRISSAIFQTEDAKEGPRAFAEKRKPVWTGEVTGRRSIPRTPCIIGVVERATRGIRRSSATAARPSRSRCGSTSRGSPSATPGRSGLLGALDSLQIVYCQTWEYDDAVARLARPARRRPASSSLLRHRRHDDAAAGERDARSDAARRDGPRADHERGGVGDQAAAQDARASATRRRSRRPSGRRSRGSRRPIRSRSRTRCSRPGSRSRCSTTRGGRVSASASTSTAPGSARCSRR